MIDTNRIRTLLRSNLTGYRVSQLVDVRQQMYDRYRKGQSEVENMTLKTAEELMKIIKLEENRMYKLIVKEEGKLQEVKVFDTFQELKQHLIQTDYFSWIHDEEPEKELPNFEEVEYVGDIQLIFEEFDYSWWTMEVKHNERIDK